MVWTRHESSNYLLQRKSKKCQMLWNQFGMKAYCTDGSIQFASSPAPDARRTNCRKIQLMRRLHDLRPSVWRALLGRLYKSKNRAHAQTKFRSIEMTEFMSWYRYTWVIVKTISAFWVVLFGRNAHGFQGCHRQTATAFVQCQWPLASLKRLRRTSLQRDCLKLLSFALEFSDEVLHFYTLP